MNATDATETKSYRDSLIRELLSHSLAAISENRGGWSADRLDVIHDCDWDLAEADENHKPFLFACYAARLRASGKSETFRPIRHGA